MPGGATGTYTSGTGASATGGGTCASGGGGTASGGGGGAPVGKPPNPNAVASEDSSSAAPAGHVGNAMAQARASAQKSLIIRCHPVAFDRVLQQRKRNQATESTNG